MSRLKKPDRVVQIAQPSIGEDELQAVREPLSSGWLTQGPKVASFEKAFGQMHSVEFCLATTSCTTALHLALSAMDISAGDEVIVPSFTWVSTANVVIYCGAKPVLCDVDPVTFNIDISSMTSKLSKQTKAVIVVHLFGLCADVDGVREALPDDIAIVEDAACAAGALYKGKPAGALGDVAAFSFHPRKSITCGEGGMLTTKNSELATKAQTLRNHGAAISEEERHQGPKPWLLPSFDDLGFNYRMTDIQAAIALVQLEKLEKFILERASFVQRYRERLSDIDWLSLPEEPDKGRHAWQALVMRINAKRTPISRNELMSKLHSRGVATRPGTHALHTLGYYARTYDYKPGDFPGALVCEENSIAVPLHNRMDNDDLDYVVDMIKESADV